jgi:hypothetical protein
LVDQQVFLRQKQLLDLLLHIHEDPSYLPDHQELKLKSGIHSKYQELEYQVQELLYLVVVMMVHKHSQGHQRG